MSINYNFIINTVKRINENSFSDAVVQVYWTLIGQNEAGSIGKMNGTTSFSTNTLNSSGDFIPYEQLTTEKITQWVQESITEEYDSYLKANIEQQLNMPN